MEGGLATETAAKGIIFSNCVAVEWFDLAAKTGTWSHD